MSIKLCPACEKVMEYDHEAESFLSLSEADNSYSIFRCSGCGFRNMDPYPCFEDYQHLYSESYYERSQSTITNYRTEKKELSVCYTRIAARFVEMSQHGPLLDIGCGTGEFMIAALAAGLSIEGVEPSEYARLVATELGHKVWAGTLFDVPLNSDGYAGVHCSHVLEHVPDAQKFLERIFICLRPGAPAYFEVPLQFDSVLDRIKLAFKKRYSFSSYSIHHHYFFTPKSLRLMLEANGFEVVSLSTFLPCRRALRPAGVRKLALQSLLWLADRFWNSGDVISVWAFRRR